LAAVGFPFITALVNAIAALVLFVKVTVFAALVLGISTVPKLRVVGATVRVAMGVNFATNASEGPFRVVRKAVGAVVGKTGKGVADVADENV